MEFIQIGHNEFIRADLILYVKWRKDGSADIKTTTGDFYVPRLYSDGIAELAQPKHYTDETENNDLG